MCGFAFQKLNRLESWAVYWTKHELWSRHLKLLETDEKRWHHKMYRCSINVPIQGHVSVAFNDSAHEERTFMPKDFFFSSWVKAVMFLNELLKVPVVAALPLTTQRPLLHDFIQPESRESWARIKDKWRRQTVLSSADRRKGLEWLIHQQNCQLISCWLINRLSG